MIRIFMQRLSLAFLMSLTLMVLPLPANRRKDLNNPDKIGHRRVAHRSIISPEKESAIGKQYAAQVETTIELVQDPVVRRYVTMVAENVVRNSDLKGSVTVKVIKSHDADSLSLPGGFIYLKSGLLASAENEDAIAGAIAHQVAHAAARHWASHGGHPTLDSMRMACRGFMAARRTSRWPAWVSPVVRDGMEEAYLNGMPVAFLKYLRRDELEADYLALQYIYKAGYSPSVYVGLLRSLASQQPTSPSLPDTLQDMPPVSVRIEQAEEEIRTILPNPPSPTKPSPEFLLMKSHL